MRPALLTTTLLLFAATAAFAQTPSAAPSLSEVGTMVKPLLIESLPPILYEHTRNWGKTTLTANGVHWHGLRPEVVKTPRNDGHWQKVRLVPRDLHKLDFKLTDATTIDAEKQTFKAYLDFVAGVEYEQQLWERGVRVYSGETRARLRVQAWVDIESTFKVDTSKSFDIVFRLKATKATVGLSHLVVEHTAGIGGAGAKLLGEAIESIVKEVEPNLQRRLQERIQIGLVKAADTREIRIGFSSLLAKKK
jgi:hypothetical protein